MSGWKVSMLWIQTQNLTKGCSILIPDKNNRWTKPGIWTLKVESAEMLTLLTSRETDWGDVPRLAHRHTHSWFTLYPRLVNRKSLEFSATSKHFHCREVPLPVLLSFSLSLFLSCAHTHMHKHTHCYPRLSLIKRLNLSRPQGSCSWHMTSQEWGHWTDNIPASICSFSTTHIIMSGDKWLFASVDLNICQYQSDSCHVGELLITNRCSVLYAW